MKDIILVKSMKESVKLGNIDLNNIDELGQLIKDLQALNYNILIQKDILYILNCISIHHVLPYLTR